MKTMEERRLYARTYRHKNREKLNKTNRDFTRKKRGYFISDAEYNFLLKAQNGVCAICGEIDKTKILAVDHCHKTGEIRGLLCSNCNLTLGTLEKQSNLEDYLGKLRLSIEYLNRYKSGQVVL